MDLPVRSDPAVKAGRPRRHATWLVGAALVVSGGLLVSFLAASAVADNKTDTSRKAFQTSAAGVASTLQLAIQHEDDIIVDAGGLGSDPDLTQTEFSRWAVAARTLERYPEMAGLAVLKMVADADLPAFAVQAESDPVGVLPNGEFTVEPPGPRPFYCLVSAAIATEEVADAPGNVDYCATPMIRDILLKGRDSGEGAYLPYLNGGRTWLAMQTPIYGGGATPSTDDARREAFVGWVAMQLDPTVILDRALRDHPGWTALMRYQAGGSDVTFNRGAPETGAETATVDLHNGWTVHVSGVIETGSITEGDALLLLLAGVLASLLLGVLIFVLGTGRERARRQLQERTKQLHHQALHDALTGLPNRALVMDRAEQLLERDRRDQTTGAALFLDLDDFKNINDTLGHRAGDRLLVAVTARLSSALRGVDTIGRMGGDEFVVLLDGSTLDVAPELVAERLLGVLHQPFEIDESPLPITVNVSIGIATGDRESAGDLLRDADVALYEAKAAGKNCYAIFDPLMQTEIGRRTDLEFDLRSALEDNQFRLVYQPIYRLDDLTVVGVEALLRWAHPTKGVVGPNEFIPILERTGRIHAVGRWVLHEACRQLATWHSRGDTLELSVNVSARQLDNDGTINDIRDALRVSGLPATALIIEVTETALMHNVHAVAERLHAIKNLGVRIAVDDFGTGYSSLAYLRQFPVDCLKIDRTFTSDLDSSPESRALVDTLVQLGKDLGLSTLAEGVETTAEMDTLRDADVDQVQGFLMARPLDPETLEAQFLSPRRQVATSQRD